MSVVNQLAAIHMCLHCVQLQVMHWVWSVYIFEVCFLHQDPEADNTHLVQWEYPHCVFGLWVQIGFVSCLLLKRLRCFADAVYLDAVFKVDSLSRWMTAAVSGIRPSEGKEGGIYTTHSVSRHKSCILSLQQDITKSVPDSRQSQRNKPNMFPNDWLLRSIVDCLDL